MDTPKDIDAVIKRLLRQDTTISVLAPEDEAYLSSLITGVRAGRKAVVILEEDDGALRYMISNADRSEAVVMMGKVLEATGRRMREERDGESV